MAPKRTKKKIANVVGPQLRKIRYGKGLTQEEFAVQCQVAGLNISRGTLSQIEAQLRCVSEFELFQLSRILKVPMDGLFPEEIRKRKI